jgi:predicted NBD/HSP70 family sugar kinase
MATSNRIDARARVFALLADRGALSRADLARQAALAPSTVSAVVSELQAEGLVVEADNAGLEPARSLPGRPPQLIALHRRAGVALGIDLGRRHVHVAVADLSHRLIAEHYERLEAELPAAEAVPLVVELARETMREASVGEDEIVGVGMGLPGPIHRPTGLFADAAIMPGWVGVRPREVLSEALGRPVEVENDANLGALGEWMWGAGRGADDVVFVKTATGIGAGFIVDGRPYTGASGSAGELGHTVLDPRGPICPCGNRGCLETIASSTAIVAALRETYGEELTIDEVIARALEGDAGCRRAITDAGRAIGAALASVCNLFNPSRIVIGGDLPAAGELLLDPLREMLSQGSIRSAAEDAEVRIGELAGRAYVLGAIALVLRRGVTQLDRRARRD